MQGGMVFLLGLFFLWMVATGKAANVLKAIVG